MADFGSPFTPKSTPEMSDQKSQPVQSPTGPSSPSVTSMPPHFIRTVPDGQYSEYNTLSGKLPPPHKPEINLTTTTPNIKTPACTSAFNNCLCPQSVAWQYQFQNCSPKFFPLPQNCEIRPYPANYRVYDLNELIYERSRTLNSNWNPYHFWNNQQAMYQFLASNLNLNNDPNLKPMDLNKPLTQYCFGCQGRKPGEPPVVPPRYLSF